MKKKNDEFYKIFQNKGMHHFKQLYFANKRKFQKGCGSYLFNGYKYIYDKSMYEKQKLLFKLCKQNKKVLEIGNYMGHSILIMLLANPKIHITAVDINDKYAKPSLDYLQKQFPNSKINFIHGDSLKILKNLKGKFDLFHVDGTHAHNIISKEFLLLLNLCKKKINILFDDVSSMPYLKRNLLKNFQVIESFIPNSTYANFYVKLKIDNKTLRQSIKNFQIENYKIFFQNQLIEILIKKIFYNKINLIIWRLFFKNFTILSKLNNKLKKKLHYPEQNRFLNFKRK